MAGTPAAISYHKGHTIVMVEQYANRAQILDGPVSLTSFVLSTSGSL